ncbi:hypothetical protein MXB_3219, partial [Myxobolus squamalis]
MNIENMNKFNSDFLVMEVKEDFLENFEIDQEIFIVGGNEGPAVLCTEKKTFGIKTSETSNSLIIIGTQPPEQIEKRSDQSVSSTHQIEGIITSFLEITQIKPSPQKLMDILKEYPYKGPINEKIYNNDSKFSLQKLSEYAQCSKSELIDILQRQNAIIIDGFWRVIDDFYISKCVVQILNLIDEKSWDLKSIPIPLLYQVLECLFPSFVIRHCLKLCGTLDSTESTAELNEPSSASFVATYILSAPRCM